MSRSFIKELKKLCVYLDMNEELVKEINILHQEHVILELKEFSDRMLEIVKEKGEGHEDRDKLSKVP